MKAPAVTGRPWRVTRVTTIVKPAAATKRPAAPAPGARAVARAAAERRAERRRQRRDAPAGLSEARGLRPLPPALQGRGEQAPRPGAASLAAPPADQRRSAQGGEARASGLRRLRGVGRRRQGRGDQAAGRATRPPSCARGPVRRAHAGRAAPSLPVAVLAPAAWMGRHDHLRPQLVRPGPRRAGREPRHRGAVAPRLSGDQRLRAHAGRRGNDRDQALDAHVARRAVAPFRPPPRRRRSSRGS